MKEVACLHIGQAGVQMGNALWELLCAEHGINETGYLGDKSSDNECLDTFFSFSHTGTYVPRTIFVDLEATVIDEVRSGSYKNLFHPDRLISGPEDAANNFARGFFTVGKLLLSEVNHAIKRLLESAENTQAIFIFRSLGGGTGSGLTAAIFDNLVDYTKLNKIEMPVYPAPTLSTAMVEPYNCLLSEHFCMEDIDVGLLVDNEALYDICSKYLSFDQPTYSSINRLISQMTSSITASIRFENIMNCDISVLQTNLVPYPRIHFPLANFAPVLCASKVVHEEVTVSEITRAVFGKDNQMIKIDHTIGRFMSCSLFYRGNVSAYHVYLALHNIKANKHIEFVDWCPTGFKVGINIKAPTIIPASGLCQTSRNLTMLANTSAIGQAWQRLTHKFYLLYSKRSFVHWFVGEGMEECEFAESLYNMSALVKDYEEVTIDRDLESNDNPVTSKSDIKKANEVSTKDKEDNNNDETVHDESSIKRSTNQEEHYAHVHEINENVDKDIEEDEPNFTDGKITEKENSESNESEENDHENQNFNFQEIGKPSNNFDPKSDQDNTLDNIEASIAEEEMIVKKFYSTIF